MIGEQADVGSARSGPGKGTPVGRGACRVAGAIAVALMVANCASTSNVSGRRAGKNYGVAASPRVIPEGEPIPKGGGRDMTGRPYVVGGRTYVPTDGRGYAREGWASWYGTAFHGRLTANGEIFDRDSIAAAHPTLPLPSYIRVTNAVNKRSMVVRVNDRGPYEQDRLLDVSERVAEALDFRRKGTTRIRVEYLGKASTRGSDDAKLLATLRTDGTPAPYGRGRSPVMLADLREEPSIRPSTLPRIVEADAASGESEPPAKVAAPAARGFQAVETDDAPVTLAAAPAPPSPPARPQAPADASPAPPRAALATLPESAPEPLPPHRPHLAGIY